MAVAYTKIQVATVVDVHVPSKATHFGGNLTDEPSWYYCSQVGVGGDHWWYWDENRHGWYLYAHHKPNWCHPIAEAPGLIQAVPGGPSRLTLESLPTYITIQGSNGPRVYGVHEESREKIVLLRVPDDA